MSRPDRHALTVAALLGVGAALAWIAALAAYLAP
jgi:hypothetical protein